MQTVSHIPGTQAAVLLIYKKGVTSSFKAGIIIFLLFICRLHRNKRFNDKAHSKQVSVRYCINRATSVPYNYVSFLYQPKLIPVNSFSKFSWRFYEFFILSAHQCFFTYHFHTCIGFECQRILESEHSLKDGKSKTEQALHFTFN